MEAFFSGHGFDPHRHDTYAMGFTLGGVQRFRYRGTARLSAAGQVFVLHPDEVHDGRAGTAEGFRYNILYIEPRLIQEALGGPGSLPFVRDAVSRDARLATAIKPALEDLTMILEELQRDEVVLGIAEALCAVDGSFRRRSPSKIHRRAVHEACDFLDRGTEGKVTSTELERVTGLSRFTLARAAITCGFADQSHLTRSFKKAYGLTPGRWVTVTKRS